MGALVGCPRIVLVHSTGIEHHVHRIDCYGTNFLVANRAKQGVT
jgi:hypothetical protein